MVLDYETSKLLVMQAAWLKDKGVRNTRETSLAKWHATESAFKAANLAIQVHGAYGYSAEYGIERYFRNARAPIIYEGTTQIHKMMQAEHALGYRRPERAGRRHLPARIVGSRAVRALAALAAALALAWRFEPPHRRRPACSSPASALGGVRIGMTKQEVQARWGTSFGRCRGCTRETWYFNYRPFDPQGAGVSFARGRVVARLHRLASRRAGRHLAWRRARSGRGRGHPDLSGRAPATHAAATAALVLSGRRAGTASSTCTTASCGASGSCGPALRPASDRSFLRLRRASATSGIASSTGIPTAGHIAA